MQDNNILVIGDVMLDRYWFSQSKELCKEAPVPAVSISKTDNRAGGAANVALNIKKLGGKTIVVGSYGKNQQYDEIGQELTNILKTEGIDIPEQHWQYNSSLTIAKHRIIAEGQQIIRVDFEHKYEPIVLDDQLKNLIKNSKIILLSDYNKGSLGNIEELIEYAYSLNKIILIDPKGNNFSKYKNATLLKPNYKEFTDIVGPITSEQEFDDKARKLIQDLNLKYLLVTCGSKGMMLYDCNNNKHKNSAYANQVYDVTGAGDTVIASLAVCLANNRDIVDAVERCSHAAALVVSKVGTSYIIKQDLDKQEKKHYYINNIDTNIGASDSNKKITNKVTVVTQDDLNTHKSYLEQKTQKSKAASIISLYTKDILDIDKIKQYKNIKDATPEIEVIVLVCNNKAAFKVHTVENIATMLSHISAIDKIFYSNDKTICMEQLFEKIQSKKLEDLADI